MKTFDVLSVGLAVCDIIAKPIRKGALSADSSRIDTLKTASGGDALNAAVNMAKLGLKVCLIGKVGRDMFGDYLVNEASRWGVNTDMIARDEEAATSASIVLVEENGERHFLYYGKANDSLSIRDIPDEAIRSAKIVHVGSAMALAGLDGYGTAELFKKAKVSGAMTSLDVTWDSDGKWLGKIEEALYFTDIFVPSLQEAQRISGKTEPDGMAAFFQSYGVKVFAVKLGGDGCFVTDGKEAFTIPPFHVAEVADTTGAGDAFMAGFLAGTVRGFPLRERGVLGNAVAANCVMAVGATGGTKNWVETMEFIQYNKLLEKAGGNTCR